MYIIVGLGNPGKKYQGTRHNVGFDAIDYIARQAQIDVHKSKFRSLIGEGFISGQKVILVKPQTYMNLSGQAVQQIVDYYAIERSQLLVIYDDIDIPLGTLRIRKKGSAGTHNGMRHIIKLLGTDEFARMRIGIGKSERIPLRDFVLTRYHKAEVAQVEEAIVRCYQAITMTLSETLDKAMNEYNG